VWKINNVLERSPDEPLTESDVTPVDGESSDVITHLLAKPIKFKCVACNEIQPYNALRNIRKPNVSLLVAAELKG